MTETDCFHFFPGGPNRPEICEEQPARELLFQCRMMIDAGNIFRSLHASIYIYIYVPDIIYLYIYIHTYYKDKTSYLDYICIIFHIYFMQRISSLSLTPPPPILLPTNKLQAASVTGPKPCSSGGEPLSGLRQRETTPTPPIRYSHLWKLHLRKVPF